ncbi:hypothetical protein EHQ52_03980 [Leptospira koniambonensis]|uniref:Uncharacterized protein n=1 Tax=Leptospira koniambonensis TaxID=2484950 RepID=A0A4R9JCM8_9LEPT|nr:hypothetical protein [Leptospira koniambonensis]TGL35934.1 hypothetical protein EHQ52_03980 [Leptospira koniambonensis]
MKNPTKSDKNSKSKYRLAAEKLALGFSAISIANDLGIHRSTIYEWMKEGEFNSLIDKYKKSKSKKVEGPLSDLYRLEKERSQRVLKQYRLINKYIESSHSDLSKRIEELNKGKFKGSAEEAGAIRIAFQFSEGKINTYKFVFENILGGTPSQYVEVARKKEEKERIQKLLQDLQNRFNSRVKSDQFNPIGLSVEFLQSAIPLIHDKDAVEQLTSMWSILSKSMSEHEKLKYHKSQLVTIDQFNQLLKIIEEIMQKKLGDNLDLYDEVVDLFRQRLTEVFPSQVEFANEEDAESA